MKSLMSFFRSEDNALKKASLEKIAAFLERSDLSTIPVILARINENARNPKVDARDFAAIYQMDQASSARLVRTANSAYYAAGAAEVVVGIQAALVRVGFRKAIEILHSSTVCRLFKSNVVAGDYSTDALWKHCMAVAVGARLIYDARLGLGVPPCDPYLAGLLHDLGISVENACLYQDGFQQAVIERSQTEGALNDCETKFLGVTHEEVGVALGRQWNFPDGLLAAIGGHHRVNHEANETGRLVHAVRVAEWICHEVAAGYSDLSPQQAPAYEQSRQALGMRDEVYAGIKAKLSEEMKSLDAAGWFSNVRLKH